MSKFNEDSRVKIPALLHLTRLGYEYLSLKGQSWDKRNNIFPEIFRDSIVRINPGCSASDADRLIEDINLALQNEDLGKAFYTMLTARSGLQLFDFDNIDNNSFHVVTELTCENGEDNFRPDITLLINGMPLVFIEVKKRLNRGGVLDERKRMDERAANPKFRPFINATQVMLFSNNMKYDDSSPEPIQGAFYATASYGEAHFNYFREEQLNHVQLAEPCGATEKHILTDTNLVSIKSTPEFSRNKAPDTPTNQLCSSLLSKQRLAFLLRYSIAYLSGEKGIEKHIMRYPQLFATQAIGATLASGVRKGIIWHTQGSGKTALAYYNVRYLADHFQRQGIVPRFYFIVDRLDLLTQAKNEFKLRGLVVHVISSRDQFARDIKTNSVIQNDRGVQEITVVNIQKFKDDPSVTAAADYDLKTQRIYFLDEVHRSYNPSGSFLANLEQSDRNAIKIGLTGTPLIGDAANSKQLFGEYIHKYYYNASIADGYTLRLMREAIETSYQLKLQQVLAELDIKKGGIKKGELYAHRRFVSPMLDYILDDFKQSRIRYNNQNMAGMVICDSSDQAKELYRQFQQRAEGSGHNAVASNDPQFYDAKQVAESSGKYHLPKPLTAQLILHDVGSKDDRKDWIEDFKKKGTVDLLFVYNMLLTGFDAPRLKKLYLGRIVKDHNLLQALTRVNRRFEKFRFGYVVDFADIEKEFDKTNKAYYDELTAELGDEMEHYDQLFISPEEIHSEIAQIKEALFDYALDDAELFSEQVGGIQDRKILLSVVKALSDSRDLYNLIRLTDQNELRSLLDFKQLAKLHTEAQNALAALNLKRQMEQAHDSSGLLNQALEEVVFQFIKIGEAELKLADELKDNLRRTRQELGDSQDPQDPEYIKLREELERLFKSKKLSEISQAEMQANIDKLSAIRQAANKLNRENQQLQHKYHGDAKLMRVHKRLMESGKMGSNKTQLHTALLAVKQSTDSAVLGNSQILSNEQYFQKQLMPTIIQQFKLANAGHSQPLEADTFRTINHLLASEYIQEHQQPGGGY